jgi:hypothetical protein
MIKSLFAAAALTFAFSGVAFAEEMKKCDEATMKMVMEMVDKAEGDAKTMGMKEFDMAKAAMEAKDEAKCGEHLGMAEKAAMAK